MFHLAVLTQLHLPPDKKLYMTDSGFSGHTHILPLKGLEDENIIMTNSARPSPKFQLNSIQ